MQGMARLLGAFAIEAVKAEQPRGDLTAVPDEATCPLPDWPWGSLDSLPADCCFSVHDNTEPVPAADEFKCHSLRDFERSTASNGKPFSMELLHERAPHLGPGWKCFQQGHTFMRYEVFPADTMAAGDEDATDGRIAIDIGSKVDLTAVFTLKHVTAYMVSPLPLVYISHWARLH